MYVEQLAPHSVEAEESAIGAVLIDAGVLPHVAGIIAPEDFYRERHRLIWKSVLNLWRGGVAVDQVTVARDLATSNCLEEAGGMGYLSNLIAITPTSAHAVYYAGIVREMSKLRSIIVQAAKMSSDAYEERPSQEVAEAGVRGLLKLRTGELDRLALTVRELYDQHQAELLEELDSGPDFVPGVSTGFASLDRMLGGWKKGLLYVIGARTSMGKTTFANACIQKAMEANRSVYLLALETTQREMFERMWHQKARVNIQSYRSLQADSVEREQQRDALVDALNTLGASRKVTIDDRRGLTPMEIRATLQAHSQVNGPPDLVVIDYLNLVRSEESRRNRYEKVAETVQALKDLGGELQVPLLLLAQLSREPERRPDDGRRPTLADFRDAGTIEEVASSVLGLYRPAYYYPTQEEWEKAYPGQRYPKNIMEVHVLKQQSGPVGMVPLYCEVESGFMSNVGAQMNVA